VIRQAIDLIRVWRKLLGIVDKDGEFDNREIKKH